MEMRSGGGAGMIDLFVIGGGINGTGIARDAAGRGLSVVLAERGDLGEGTSSRSSKMVHGGLRYLEYYEFRLVRESLIEREVLLNAAPHLIRPMRFVIPHSPEDRPAWLVRLGLFLYDHLGDRRKLPGTRTLDLRRDPEGAPLLDRYTRGFEYSDCVVDDARLVVLNAIGAAGKGARILTRSPVTAARREDGGWTVTVADSAGRETVFRARCLVNCAGPWVSDVMTRVAGVHSRRGVRLVKGSHILVPKWWEGANAYLVQNHDRRVIFLIPHERDLALIGTTDIPWDGHAGAVEASEDEVDYLLAAANRYFKQKLRRTDVVHRFAGVRALFDDGEGNPSAVTRDYVFDLDETGGAPMLNVFGGKITTFRELAERGLARLAHVFPQMGGNWTHDAPLPGGDIPDADFESFVNTMRETWPWLPGPLLNHYARLYGTMTRDLIGDAGDLAGLGRHFGATFHEAEARYLARQEWAVTAEDMLWRRTKHGLRLGKAEQAAFARWLDHEAQEHGPAAAAARA